MSSVRSFLDEVQGPALGGSALTAEQWLSWECDGFLLLKGHVSPEQMQQVRAVVDAQWQMAPDNDHEIDILSGAWAGQAFRMSDARPEMRRDA